jgi:hypothetical protein
MSVRMNVPHASQELNETTVRVCQGNNDVGVTDTAGVDVDQGQDEGRKSESRQTQGSWVGELAVRGPVETGLEFTTEGS